MSDDHSPLPAFPSIRHCYINLFPFQSVFGSDLHKHKKMQQKGESLRSRDFWKSQIRIKIFIKVLRILIAKMFELI